MFDDMLLNKKCIIFYKGDIEYYFFLEEILFFDIEENGICVYMIKNIYNVKYKFYEFEELLLGYFMRVLKLIILNMNYIYFIICSLLLLSKVEF